MSFQKVLVQGSVGSVAISEDAGVAKVAAIASADLGGGDIKGFCKVRSTNEIELDAKFLIDAGLELAAHKFPSAAAAIEMAKGLIDAELAKV